MKQDVISFHDLYRRYAGDVHRFAYWLCSDSDDAKDLASETFVRVWTAGKKIQAKTVKAYLFTITRNLFLQKERRVKRQTKLDMEVMDDSHSPESIAEDRSELRAVFEALRQVPEPDRTALVLRARDGMSYQEIATVLDISLALVKIKIHRARVRLTLIRADEEKKHEG